MPFRRRSCYFCDKKITNIDYKDPVLGNFVTERGKIFPTKVSGVCTRHQRKLTRAIKRARIVGLLGYTGRGA